MNIEDLALEHQETKDRSIRNEGRIEKLETEKAVLHQLATSVAVMAEQMKSMNANVSTLTGEVEELKTKPGKRWESLIEKIIWAVVAAFLGYVFANIGL
jgi:cell division protein FtsL